MVMINLLDGEYSITTWSGFEYRAVAKNGSLFFTDGIKWTSDDPVPDALVKIKKAAPMRLGERDASPQEKTRTGDSI